MKMQTRLSQVVVRLPGDSTEYGSLLFEGFYGNLSEQKSTCARQLQAHNAALDEDGGAGVRQHRRDLRTTTSSCDNARRNAKSAMKGVCYSFGKVFCACISVKAEDICQSPSSPEIFS